MTTGGNIVIPDAGNIGSASDTDAIAIASNGAVTLSQAASFSSTIGSSGTITATVAGTGLKSVGANAQIHADASSGYGALIADGAASQSSFIFFQTAGTDKGRITVDSSGNFEIGSGGTTTGLKVDDGGHVTMPLQSAVFAYPNATQDNMATGIVTIVLGAEVYDVNSDFDTSNSTFTAPVTGKYQVNASVSIKDVDTDYQWMYGVLLVSSNRNYYMQAIQPRYEITQDYASYGRTFNASALVDMDANDTLLLKVRTSAHGAAQHDVVVGTASATETFLSVHLAC
jgi:hypothetical protein